VWGFSEGPSGAVGPLGRPDLLSRGGSTPRGSATPTRPHAGTQGESPRLYYKAATAYRLPNDCGTYEARVMPLVAAAVLSNVDQEALSTEDTAQGGMEPLRPSRRGL